MRAVAGSLELADTRVVLNVRPEEYIRLLGYPRGYVLEGRALELATWARDWYAEHGRPWVYARQVERFTVDGDTICVDGSGLPVRA